MAGPAPDGSVPDEAYLLALARLPRLGPARLRWLVDTHGAAGAWQAVLAGSVDPTDLRPVGREAVTQTVAGWRRDAQGIDRAGNPDFLTLDAPSPAGAFAYNTILVGIRKTGLAHRPGWDQLATARSSVFRRGD